jgi:tetratricopeptide (TPR) repeat protein
MSSPTHSAFAYLVGIFVLALSATGCRTSPTQEVKKGNEFFEKGKYQDAELHYRKAIQKDTNSGEAHYRLGLVDLRLAHASNAYAELNRAVQLSPGNQDAKKELAEICLASYLHDPQHGAKMYEQVRTLTGQMLAADPKSAEAFRLQGYLALTENKAEEALDRFRRASQNAPGDPAVTTGLAEALIRAGHEAEGEQAAQDVIRHSGTYAPAYDLLLSRYVAAQKFADVEALLKTRVANDPKNGGALLQLASFYEHEHRTADAEAILKKLRDNPKDFPHAYLLAGDFHAVTKNWTAAELDFQQGLTVDSQERINYLSKLAGVYALQGKDQLARRTYEQLLESDPKDPHAREALAHLLAQSSSGTDRDRAVAMYYDLLREKPGSTDLNVGLGQALFAQGKVAEAQAQFQDAAKSQGKGAASAAASAELSLLQRDFAGVLRYSEQALAQEPSNPRLRFLHAVGLMGTSAFPRARTEFTELLRDNPQSMDAQVELGYLDLAEKRYPEAEKQFQKLYQPGQQDLRPLRGLVQLNLLQKQPLRSIQLIEQALLAAPNSTELVGMLVGSYMAAGHADVAQQQLSRMIAANPRDAELRIQLAAVARQRNDLETSYKSLQAARNINPDRAGMDGMLASVEAELGHLAEAQADYRKALEKFPQDPTLLSNLAFLLTRSSGHLDEALQLVQKGLQKSPQEPHLLDTAGWIYIQKNQAHIAVPMLRRLTEKYPNDVDFRYHYGVALLSEGNKGEARKELEQALQKHPTESQQKEIGQALKRVTKYSRSELR